MGIRRFLNKKLPFIGQYTNTDMIESEIKKDATKARDYDCTRCQHFNGSYYCPGVIGAPCMK